MHRFDKTRLARFEKGESTVASMKVSIKAAAQELGVREETLRRWEQAGKITSERTMVGHRRYDLGTLRLVQEKRERTNLEQTPSARVSQVYAPGATPHKGPRLQRR